MDNKTGFANIDTLSDVQITEMQVLFVGFQKFVKSVMNILFEPMMTPLTIWEVILIQERLDSLNECLNDVLHGVVKVDENVTVNGKSVVASLSTEGDF